MEYNAETLHHIQTMYVINFNIEHFFSTWLYNIARGINLEPVTTRLVSKSIGCCKKFPGRGALTTSESVQHWLNELAAEIVDRLEQDMLENSRRAKQIVVSYAQEINMKDVSGSKTTILNSYNQKRICEDSFAVLKKQCMKTNGSFCLKFLGLSAGNFENCKNVREITAFFKNGDKSNCKNLPGSSVQQFSAAQKIDMDENSLHETSKNLENSKTGTDYAQSLYDVSTDEQSSVNSEDLVFYEDTLMKKTNCGEPKKTSNKDSNDFTLFATLTSLQQQSLDYASSDEDSISNEIFCTNQKANSEIKQVAKGDAFFIKYIDDVKTNNEEQVKRDFNTSKVLESALNASEDDSTSELEEEAHGIKECENNFPKETRSFNDIFNKPSTSCIDGKVPCSECGKKILESDIISHMDYHFALKIVRSEADLYKPNKSTIQNKTTKNSGKRKAVQCEGQHTLESFIKKNVSEDSQECETCSECNKRICKSELESHRDYHVAKKLHVEINPNITTPLKNITVNKEIKKSKTKQDKIKPVTAFFKPT